MELRYAVFDWFLQLSKKGKMSLIAWSEQKRSEDLKKLKQMNAASL